ncbi:putative ubiquitin-conjugating enzyme E2 14 [Rhexocercosporidium sp. MPI-PUGE-AT-0058]|nr:putative ubiquitin-conjugating enzyme E2 14 [Rhexocercosporidium sp. MPI-PUGE-AT-0058]
MGSSQKRIAKELAEVTESPPAGIKVTLVDEANIHNWNIVMDGPDGSPYAGGKFTLLLALPHEYPFKPPKISFKTRIWHPNVTFDEHGSMCIGILKADAWKPSSKIMSVLTATQQLMMEPVPDDAVEQGAAQKFKEDRKQFDKEARDYTEKYAKGKK